MMLIKPKYFLGLDCGSVSLKMVVMDEHLRILWSDYRRTQGEPLIHLQNAARAMFADERLAGVDEFAGIFTTGSGRSVLANLLDGESVNEITAHGLAAAHYYPETRTIIEIGGQDSKLILLDRVNGETVIAESQMNDICAAGTGSFLDQQAYRIGISVERLSEEACRSNNPAKISGRCSVFAKTDMIHMQQDGISVSDLAAGLCYAVSKTYVENLVKGRMICKPILFQGGVARNQGVRKALSEVLQLNEQDLVVPDNFDIMGAIGSILYGTKRRPCRKVSASEVLDRIEAAQATASKQRSQLNALTEQRIIVSESPIIDRSGEYAVPVYLGIDVGSVTVKMVAIDDDRQLLFKHYTAAKGTPIEAIQECFQKLREAYPNPVHVLGVGVTGSGRDYIANYLKADTVKNEITAQASGIAFLIPDVNSIIEIGGQDSKYIRIENGTIVDFVMNKTCAAGTGSFLAEQADRLGVPLEHFSARALAAIHPLDMGTRCTVFMETDCIHHQQSGKPKNDILAGLSYSIAKNYIEKVAGNRPLEGKVVIQGGNRF